MAVPSRECSTEDSSKASRAVCKGVRGEASADSFKNRSGLVRPSVAFLVKQLAASPLRRIPDARLFERRLRVAAQPILAKAKGAVEALAVGH